MDAAFGLSAADRTHLSTAASMAGSGERQVEFMRRACGMGGASSPTIIRLEGESAVDIAIAGHPLARAIRDGYVRRDAVVLATAPDRLSRTPGMLRDLVDLANHHGVHIITVMGDLDLLARTQNGGYVKSSLGTLFPPETPLLLFPL